MNRPSLHATTRQRKQRLYVYKLTSDDGGAPCIDGGDLLSLAICKPRIRTTARAGDLIFGFAANSLDRDNRLIYVAKVSEVLSDAEYYDGRSHRRRSDCIYTRGSDGRFTIRRNARYHASGSQLTHDLGSPYEYKRASTLLSRDFRYFGSSAAVDLNRYPAIREMLARLGQGHRVDHSDRVTTELRSLSNCIWQTHSERVNGSPSQTPRAVGRHCGSC